MTTHLPLRGQHNDKQSARTLQYTDWTALLKEAQNLNGGQSCVFDGPYHAGGRHIVRRIEFIEGQLCLVRIPILSARLTSDQNNVLKWWTTERRFTMESEIAMKFIAGRTDIPIPTIFGYRTSLDGKPVKLSYMLMQCIRGNMLFDLGGPSILTSEQKSRIRKSIAAIQCQMATASIDKLGSLILGPNGTIDIGPLPASFGFEGPFISAEDYFLSWAAHVEFGNLEFLHNGLEDNDRLRSLKQEVISFPSRLKSIVKSMIEKRNPTAYENCYPIVHRDFLLHNILFDDSYNIVGVIDWEFAHSAPLEVFTSLTNMYSRFDSEALHAITDRDDEGRQYIKEVMDEDMRQGCKLSMTFGKTLGDIGLCMTYFEEGRAVLFGKLLNRYESETVDSLEP